MVPHPGIPASPDRRALAQHSNAWPFVEARELLKRVEHNPPAKGYVLFETGYGPSGLPHIGTFAEVARTAMIRRAFAALSDLPTRLFAYSDDMDGLRSVPDNVPNREELAKHLGKPLTAIPDPFGTHPSFGEHNNARLRSFLDAFGFDYEFVSATESYRSGRLDAVLMAVLRHYEAVRSVVLPILGPDRRATYSPFLPVCADTGRVLEAKVLDVDADAGTLVYEDAAGRPVETAVTGGRCKLQWRVDWAARWAALDVDFEIWGKDLIDSAKLADRICRILGGRPPLGFAYELFLDENGEKISKSRGNGLAVEEWLRYAPPESLAYFMYLKPRTAKRLYFDVIPRCVDEYLTQLERYQGETEAARLANPVWHIHPDAPPDPQGLISFAVLLNLTGVCHSEDPKALWSFVARYYPGLTPETAPLTDKLIGYAITYYRDFVKPRQKHRPPSAAEKAALADLAQALTALPADASAEVIQTEIYEVGKRHPAVGDLRAWFKALYQILLGQDEGPRMGSFVAVYGLSETVALIRKAIS